MFLVGFVIIVLTLAAPFMLVFGVVAVLWWLVSTPVTIAARAGQVAVDHQREQRRLQELGGAAPPVPGPGWYPDVDHPGQERWWDGERWMDLWRPMNP